MRDVFISVLPVSSNAGYYRAEICETKALEVIDYGDTQQEALIALAETCHRRKLVYARAERAVRAKIKEMEGTG